ncbi:WD40 protein [Cryptosporidium canis]|uniref:WD40 protein n=1 Tax=Cryptosporidium canis TaxID=195482 RepID=A0ABQ8PCY7_9CRYT|nr:WD40 protein [Cryptosporidium canis]KAJ1614300.1 WD40 protein [Cryptosporidium canis]
MSHEIEISGIFSLPELNQLVGEAVTQSPSCQAEARRSGEQFLRIQGFPVEDIHESILETESILNKVFNSDNFSMIDSSTSETNEGSKCNEPDPNAVTGQSAFGESPEGEDQDAEGSLDELSGVQYDDTQSEFRENPEEKGGNEVNEADHRFETSRNSNSGGSEMDSLDDYTTFDYGFDGSAIISSLEDWESDDSSIDFRFNEMAWPEEASAEDDEIGGEASKGADEEEMRGQGVEEAPVETSGEGEDYRGFGSFASPVKDEKVAKESEFVAKEIEIGKIDSTGRCVEVDTDEGDVIYVKRGPGSESSFKAVRGALRVPSVEQEVSPGLGVGESVEASSSSSKFKKWLSGGQGGSKLQSYLGAFKENIKESSVASSAITLRSIFKSGGVFRRGGYLSSSSFNSSLISSLGTAASLAEKSQDRVFKDNPPGQLQATVPGGAQEARRSLRQRTLPMKISTKYQINNKTRKVRENDVGSIWLIREIYLSLVPQILKLSMSVDGQWLILGSQDGSIRQWRFKEEDTADFGMLVSSSSQIEPFFSEREDLCVQGHSNAIISLQWENDERSHRFLSSSMDRTVKLWEAGSDEPSAVINCSDWPTAASFHPVQKNIIFIGSLDASVQILRLIPGEDSNRFQAKVVETIRVQDLLTSLSISPNGKYLACGFKDGGVAFYDARTLKYRCDVDCRNRRGKSSKGRKVSGISWKRDNKSVLVTTNDSRVRLFNLSDLSTFVKFKGHINEETLLSAQISNDERFIVSGSENGYICLWDLQQDYGRSILGIQYGKSCTNSSNFRSSAGENPISLRYDRINIRRGPTQHCVDSFKAFDSSLTSTILAPPAFSKRIIKFFKLHHRTSLNYPSFGTYINERNAHVFIAVNRNGQIRFFMNIPN